MIALGWRNILCCQPVVLQAADRTVIIMLTSDLILPFTNNIGFPGIQASVLVWLFLGGLVAADNWSSDATSTEG
jgi:hypothetical protein